jgi:hypothetical protein
MTYSENLSSNTPSDWLVTSNNGTTLVASNSNTKETFTGSPAAFAAKFSKTTPVPSIGGNVPLPDFTLWGASKESAVLESLQSIFNWSAEAPKVWKSNSLSCNGATATIATPDTSGLFVGMKAHVAAGTGRFNSSLPGNANTIISIVPNTSFTVSAAPSTALVNATVTAMWSDFEHNVGPCHYETGAPGGSTAFEGAIFMPNGKVCLIPIGSLYIGLFDPKTQTYERGPAHGEGNGISWGAGCLGLDGVVYMSPQSVNFVGSYDPATNRYTRKAALTGTYGGAIVVPDGRIVMVPVTPATIAVYDPVNNSVATLAHGEAAGWSSGTYHPNGKVYMAPYGLDYVGIYDPVANTYTRGAAVGAAFGGTNRYEGVVVMPNGKMLFVPNRAPCLGIYDPVTNIWTDGPPTGIAAGTAAYTGGCMLADGRVLLFPRSGANFGLYDPKNETFCLCNYNFNGSITGACMTPGGIVVTAPSTYVGVATLQTRNEPPNAFGMALHPLYNKQ